MQQRVFRLFKNGERISSICFSSLLLSQTKGHIQSTAPLWCFIPTLQYIKHKQIKFRSLLNIGNWNGNWNWFAKTMRKKMVYIYSLSFVHLLLKGTEKYKHNLDTVIQRVTTVSHYTVWGTTLYEVIHCVRHYTGWCTTLSPGYLKALERGNSVPRPKGYCEAKKVYFSAVLLHNPLFWDLRVVDSLISKYFWQVWSTLWKARPPWDRPSLPVRGLASLRVAQPPCERPSLPVRGPASLWAAWPVRNPSSLLKAQTLFRLPLVWQGILRSPQPGFFVSQHKLNALVE